MKQQRSMKPLTGLALPFHHQLAPFWKIVWTKIERILIIDYPIPQKTNRILTSAVNWTAYDSSNEYWKILNYRAKKYAQTNHDVYKKYRNTIDFYKRCVNL